MIEDDDIDGKVPDDLVGILYRTGPGESIILYHDNPFLYKVLH